MMNSRPTRRNDKKGPIRRVSGAVSKLVNNKAFLIVFSVIAAFAVWAVLVASDGTLKRRKVFTEAPVGTTGESTLISRGLIVTDNIQELVPSANMTVEVTQANYERATASSFNPHFELSQITSEGENTLSMVFSTLSYGSVISCEPNTVTVNVERYITRRVSVSIELYGTVPEGCYLKTYKSDPSALSISGPQSIVNSINRVVVRLNLSDLSPDRPSDRTTLNIELQQSDGTVVPMDKLSVTNQSVITSSVVIETELIPAKELPLDAQAFVTGTPAEGYALREIELADDSITVAGAQDILDALTVITTDNPLDITDATESVTGYVRIRKPTGIDNSGYLPSEVAVTAVIEEETISKQFRSVNVRVRGQTAQKVTLTPARVNIKFTGPYTFIQALTADAISAYVDITGLEAGTHMLPLMITVDNVSENTSYTAEPDTQEIQTVITVQ